MKQVVWWIIAFIIIVIIVAAWYLGYGTSAPAPASVDTSAPLPAAATSSAKGVLQVEQPAPQTSIQSPLTVSGFVFGNNGTITIQLAQKDTGVVVAEKTAVVSGQSDRITFAESLQFALPVVPQPGVLTITYTDKSGRGLDDKVMIEVDFPTDLGSGLE